MRERGIWDPLRRLRKGDNVRGKKKRKKKPKVCFRFSFHGLFVKWKFLRGYRQTKRRRKKDVGKVAVVDAAFAPEIETRHPEALDEQ